MQGNGKLIYIDSKTCFDGFDIQAHFQRRKASLSGCQDDIDGPQEEASLPNRDDKTSHILSCGP